MRKIKVLVSDFHTDWGGQPAYLLDVAYVLKDLVNTQFVLPPKSVLEKRALDLGIDCHTITYFPQGSELFPSSDDICNLQKLINREEPNLIQVNGYLDQLPMGFAAALSDQKPPVYKIKHNSFPIMNNWIVEYAYKHLFTHIGVVAKGILIQFKDYFDRGVIDKNRITIHHGGINPENFIHLKSSPFSKKHSKITLGTVCRLAKEKGIDILIKSFNEIRKQIDNIELVIIGEGPERLEIEKLINLLGLEKIVHLTGFLADVRSELTNMDIFILASVDCEGSSIALKEAMATGLPVITTDIGGAKEIIENDENGIIISPNSIKELVTSIISLINDPKFCQYLGRNARKTVLSKYTISDSARSILNVYQDLSKL